MNKLLMTLSIFAATCCAYAWEEDPRIEEHNKLTEYLLKLGDHQIEEKNADTMRLLNLIVEERKKLKEKSNE